jgi:ABC-type branched-subunit amino acid transport system substrate-binding protein
MAIHIRYAFFLLTAFLLTLHAANLRADTQVASWSLDPPTILSNILKDIERDGPRDEVVLSLRTFIKDHPDSGVTDEALLRLADIYLQKTKVADAKLLYQRILEGFPLSNFKTEALYGLAYCQFKDGELKNARSNLKSLLANYNTAILLRAKAELMLSDVTSVLTAGGNGIISDEGAAIGVTLPLKGRYAAFGEGALKGILMAAGVFGERESYEIIVKDTSAKPSITSRAVKELAANNKVIGIVGPLLSITAPDAARTAHREKTPIITLSQRDGLPQIGDYVFRNFLTSAQQVEAIAGFALNVLEYKRFVTLHPDNLYGRELAKRFREEVIKGGGEILGEGSYVAGKTDFGKELKMLFQIEETERMEGRRRIKKYTRTIDADAIYIPDYADTIGLIAPQLVYYDINDITMLGSNAWNSPKLIELGGRYVEGAYFADGFFGESQNPGTQYFVNDFKRIYGDKPGIIEAQAYDATRMIIEILKRGDIDRGRLREELAALRDFNGATGLISFDDAGEAIKDIFLLMVENGRIVEAHELPPKTVDSILERKNDELGIINTEL